MDRLPVIDTTPPFKSDLPKRAPLVSDGALKIAAVVLIVFGFAVWISILSNRQTERNKALKREIQELHNSARDGITEEDVRKWSGQ
jgi:cytoskeletal protein RodZ